MPDEIVPGARGASEPPQGTLAALLTASLATALAEFWHGVFATGYTKLNQPKAILNQIDMFRRYPKIARSAPARTRLRV